MCQGIKRCEDMRSNTQEMMQGTYIIIHVHTTTSYLASTFACTGEPAKWALVSPRLMAARSQPAVVHNGSTSLPSRLLKGNLAEHSTDQLLSITALFLPSSKQNTALLPISNTLSSSETTPFAPCLMFILGADGNEDALLNICFF